MSSLNLPESKTFVRHVDLYHLLLNVVEPAVVISTSCGAELSMKCSNYTDCIAHMQADCIGIGQAALLTMAQHCAQRAGMAEETEPSPFKGVRWSFTAVYTGEFVNLSRAGAAMGLTTGYNRFAATW